MGAFQKTVLFMRKGDIKVFKLHRSFAAWNDLIDKMIKSTSWFTNHHFLKIVMVNKRKIHVQILQRELESTL